MTEFNIPLKDVPQEKLLSDFKNFKKELGADNFLVQQLANEIKRRNKGNSE